MQQLEGQLVANSDDRIAIVLSRFNELIGKNLLEGARDALLRHGFNEDNITLVRVPGAFEIPLAAQELARTGKYAAVVRRGDRAEFTLSRSPIALPGRAWAIFHGGESTLPTGPNKT